MNPIRGVKLLLPPPDGLDSFFLFLETVSRFGYNTVMLELGGAMAYASHPEINEGWLEYAAFMNEYPGKGQKIQGSFDWDKNSIHSDNGGGRVLDRETILEIIRRAEALGLEIIPEVPSLSHCDYLLIRHMTDAVRDYRHFVDGYYIDEKDWKLGDYVITLADGATLRAPVVYGLNISKSAQDWNPPRPHDLDCYSTNAALAEVAYTTLPVEIEGHTEYVFGIDLPDDAEVAAVAYAPLPGHEAESVRFAVLGASLR